MFFGNIVGHAKMLCALVESVDCWQNNPNLPNIPAWGRDRGWRRRAQDMSAFVRITTPDGTQVAAKADVVGIVKKICGVIDGGVGKLPDLIPGLVDKIGGGKLKDGVDRLLGKLPGIPDLLKKIVGGLLSGIGGIGGIGGGGGGGNGLGGSIGKIIGDIGKKIIGGLFGKFSAEPAGDSPDVSGAACTGTGAGTDTAYYDPPLIMTFDVPKRGL